MNHLTIDNKNDAKKLMKLSICAGETLLTNGAEVSRVEDTMVRLCNSRGNIHNVNSFVTQTGIFLTFEYENHPFVSFKRVKNTGINLKKISEVSRFSRKFVTCNISLDEGMKIIQEINRISTYSGRTKALFGGLAAAFFTLMFGGNLRDFYASFLGSYLVVSILNKIDDFQFPYFINNFLGAFMASLFAATSLRLGLGQNLDKIIIGSIMYLVPGVAITNAIRDTMNGDSLAGLSKAMEAIFSALAIAFGVGLVLSLHMKGGI